MLSRAQSSKRIVITEIPDWSAIDSKLSIPFIEPILIGTTPKPVAATTVACVCL